MNTEELKKEFAKYLQVSELDTREGYAVEWTVAAMKEEIEFLNLVIRNQNNLILSGEERGIEEWINVNERLPEIIEPLMGYDDDQNYVVMIPNYQAVVLAYSPEFGVFKARTDRRGSWTEISSISSRGNVSVTHWKKLPQPPNKLFNEAGERK